ncbi:hypothetical protein [Candidatus Avelusimicrobium faecicola]|uniref:hypothetical protein n=1 Tax=Candidatus Avelusimicrobium faecicola TaxID=3416205 RepID=UPI003CBC60E0|nr:hypothetical protein [Spirochaetota bacterium]
MKKIILLAACLAVVPAGAEELKFVTALSQPVASFAHLESVNNKRPAEALFVNFCNTGVSAGSISAKGLVRMNELRLTGDSQVGSSSVMNYQITEPTGFAIRAGGSVLGAKLLAEKADPRDVVVEAGVDLNDNASFMAADLASLKIGAHTTVVPSAYSNDYVMIWDDSYKANYEVSSAGVKALPGAAYNSFLLRYRMEEKDICGAGTPAASESTRTRNCADDSNYGSDYEGVINEKYSYWPDCEWKEVSNTCKKKNKGKLTWQQTHYEEYPVGPNMGECPYEKPSCDYGDCTVEGEVCRDHYKTGDSNCSNLDSECCEAEVEFVCAYK